MTDRLMAPCARCGRRRVIHGGRRAESDTCRDCAEVERKPVNVTPKEVQWRRDGNIMRPVDPERDRARRDIVGIVDAIRQAHADAKRAWMGASWRHCCPVCGCLCLADEVCPGCRAQREAA